METSCPSKSEEAVIVNQYTAIVKQYITRPESWGNAGMGLPKYITFYVTAKSAWQVLMMADFTLLLLIMSHRLGERFACRAAFLPVLNAFLLLPRLVGP